MEIKVQSRVRTRSYSFVIIVILAIACLLPLNYEAQATLGLALALGIAAVGLDILVGYGGLASFGHFAFIAIGAYVTTILQTKAGLPWGRAGRVAVVVTGLLGALLAAAMARLQSFGVALGTFFLGFVVVAALGSQELGPWTGGSLGLVVPTPSLGAPLTAQGVNLVTVAVLAIAAGIAHQYVRSRRGQRLRAVKFSDMVAMTAGIRPLRVRVEAFAVSAALAGAAGIFVGPAMSVLIPESFAPHRSVLLFAMVVVGGTGTIAGPIIGAVVLTFISQYIGQGNSYGDVLTALVLLVCLILLPNGLMSLVDPLRKWVARRVPGRWRSRRRKFREPVGLSVRASAPPTSSGPALELEHVRVELGGVVALSDLTLEVARNTIHAIVGPNGAGKTTLLNVASGHQPVTSGGVRAWGADTAGWAPAAYRKWGVMRTFQHAAVAPDLTALENVAFAVPSGTKSSRVEELAGDALSAVGIAPARWDLPGAELSLAEAKRLDIARAIASTSPLIMLDEPTAGLEHDEMSGLATLLARLRDEHGFTLLLISHHIGFIRGIANVVTVMESGHDIAQGDAAEVLANAKVMSAFTGLSAEEQKEEEVALS
jgi:ABC-type branched-subunit amino acid transport system ATPase component/ABC-type branched-subunit amino acid transport system permease subunit